MLEKSKREKRSGDPSAQCLVRVDFHFNGKLSTKIKLFDFHARSLDKFCFNRSISCLMYLVEGTDCLITNISQ